MATNQNLFATPNLREALAGTAANIRAAHQGVLNDLRNSPAQSPSLSQQTYNANNNIFAPGSFGAQNLAANHPAAAAAQATAPVPGSAPAPAPVAMPAPMAGNVFAPPGGSPVPLQAAGGLVQAQQAGQAAGWEASLRDHNLNLNPFNQSAGDFHQNWTAATGLFDKQFGAGAPAAPGSAPAGSPSGVSGLPTGVPVSTIPFTGLRDRALAANGQPVTGFGGTQVTGTPPPPGNDKLPYYKQQGAHFTLTQNPNTVPGAPGYQPAAPVQPAAPTQPAKPTTPTPYEQAAASYKDQQPGSSFTAPDGSKFMRDARGRLQAVGSDPALAAKAKGMEAEATEEAKKTVEDAHKYVGEVRDSAEVSRVQSGSINRIKELYKQGATSGFGQSLLTQAGAAMARITGKETKIANQQELEKNLGNIMLRTSQELMKGGGSVSNFERELVAKAQANPNLTPQANLQILEVMQKLADRNIALEKERIRLDDLGVPTTQISKELAKMRDTMDIGVESLRGLVAPGESQKIGKYDVVVH